MAEKDIAENNLMAYEDVFADIYNVLIFNGERIVQPEDLAQVVTHEPYRSDVGTLHEVERDTAKLWTKRNLQLALLGTENQTAIDKNMALRVIGYDGISYRSQLLENEKTNRVYPVVTLILY